MNNRLLLTLMIASAAGPALAQGAAAQGPQPVSKTVFLARIDTGFNAVDTNKDGFTDKAELESAEARALVTRKAQLLKQRETAFRQMDKDKNGTLTLTEFNAATAAQALPKPNATPAINRLDTNKDGKVSLAENRAPAAAQFDRLDSNKDGILSVDEQKARAKK